MQFSGSQYSFLATRNEQSAREAEASISMIYRSRQCGSKIIWLCWLLLCIVISLLPLPVVHSHAQLAEAGVSKQVLSRHLEVCHTQGQAQVPFEQPHFHWSFPLGAIDTTKCVPDAVVGSTQCIWLPSNDFSGNWCSPFSYSECTDRIVQLDAWHPHFFLNGPSYSGPCQRIRFCLWTC